MKKSELIKKLQEIKEDVRIVYCVVEDDPEEIDCVEFFESFDDEPTIVLT